jgi:hypothetical protein
LFACRRRMRAQAAPPRGAPRAATTSSPAGKLVRDRSPTTRSVGCGGGRQGRARTSAIDRCRPCRAARGGVGPPTSSVPSTPRTAPHRTAPAPLTDPRSTVGSRCAPSARQACAQCGRGCVRVCARARVCSCACVCVFVCVFVSVFVFLCVRDRGTRTHKHTHTHALKHAHTQADTHACAHARTHAEKHAR